MKVLTTPLGPVALLAIFFLGTLFSNFSRRLGAVTKMPDHYRWFQLANGLIVIAATSQIIRGTAAVAGDLALSFLLEEWFSLVSFHIPLALGVTLDLVLVIYYWGWILTEKLE